MPLRSRIPVRKPVAGVADENKVGTVAGRMAKDGGENAQSAAKILSAAPAALDFSSAAAAPKAGAAKVFGAAASRVAMPAKVFGAQSGRPAAGVRPRSAFGDTANVKVFTGAAAKLTKPEEAATKINGDKPLARAGRVALGNGSGLTAGIGNTKQGLPLARSRLPVISARPTGVAAAATTAVIGNRPISKPSAAFGARRPVVSKALTATAELVAVPAAAASKRARTAAAASIPDPSTVLGKHTRSGRMAMRASSADSIETTSTLAQSSDAGAQEELASETQSTDTTPTVCSSGFCEAKLGELKLVDVDTIDYALAHTGLLGEKPISMEEINEFEADVVATDTTLVPEFSDDIFGYMRELEVRLMPNPRYIALQPALTWNTRAVLVEWIVQVHEQYNLLPESLYLAVNLVDRFLSTKEIAVSKLQLVGAVCLLLATKYEEIHVPSVKDIEYMVDGNYSVADILQAERYVLRLLNFDMGWPGPLSFLRRISKADTYDPVTRTLAKYLME
ncbi:B-type cyclin, partial [Coemansia aciculifera]